MHRRSRLSAAVALSLALAGCATTTTTPTTGLSPDAVAKFSALTQGLLSIAGTEATILGVPQAQAAQIANDAKLAQIALTALQPGMATAAAAPTVASLVAEVNDVLRIVGPIASALPSPANQIVLALEVLLPVAEEAANVLPVGVARNAMPMAVSTQAGDAAQAYLSSLH